MNFDEAIQAHAAWKVKLAAYIRKNDGSLQSSEVRVDNRCPLGQWIHGEGRKFASLAEYQTLIKEHARFHLAAGGIIDKVNKGQGTTAERDLNFDSEYGVASRNVVKAIMEVKKKVNVA